MNQVQSELRVARNLIAERGSEIQRIRVTNNQVCAIFATNKPIAKLKENEKQFEKEVYDFSNCLTGPDKPISKS